jgi:hypothetical protein
MHIRLIVPDTETIQFEFNGVTHQLDPFNERDIREAYVPHPVGKELLQRRVAMWVSDSHGKFWNIKPAPAGKE